MKKKILSTVLVFAMLISCMNIAYKPIIAQANEATNSDVPTHLEIRLFLSEDTDWRDEKYHTPEIIAQEIGSKIYFGAYFIGSSAGDIEVLSSDENIIAWTNAWTGAEGNEVNSSNSYTSLFWPDENGNITKGFLTINGYLLMKKAGNATITFRSKSNPDLETKYCIGVKDPNSTCVHNEGDIITEMAPTATADGNGHTECTICGQVMRSNITAHYWDEGVITRQSTATVNGIKIFTCIACGEKKRESLPLNASTWTPYRAASAPKVTYTAYAGDNFDSAKYEWNQWYHTIKSYLTVCEDGKLMRVQALEKKLLIEYYDADYKLLSQKTVKFDLTIWGGFYAGRDAYYVVTGQNNHGESPTKEVIRVTKYDKNWKKLSHASLKDSNVYEPFGFACLRMAEYGKYLIVKSARLIYSTPDGVHHQVGITFEVNTDTMKIATSPTDYGYCSHSFNQFITIDNENIISLDHGDAYPRSLRLFVSKNLIGTSGNINGEIEEIDIMKFQGETGDNQTGATVGGLEVSDSTYLVTGTSINQTSGKFSDTQNVFVASVSKEDSKVNIHWLTSYKEGTANPTPPHLLKISDNRFLVIWSRNYVVYYTEINEKGEKCSKVYSMSGNITECPPVFYDNKIIWYQCEMDAIYFYQIPVDNISKCSMVSLFKGKACTPKLSKSKLKIYKGTWDELEVLHYPGNANWKIVSGKKIIYTRKEGPYIDIYGKKKGTAKLQATINGKKLTCKITVS